MRRYIVHFDGDSFFASVEQVMDYRLQGEPVVTGGERQAATSVSKEGKSLGLHRGQTLRDMRSICPEVQVVRSDYRSYAIFAGRMYAIARRYTPLVEEYSIDECFADITDVPREPGEFFGKAYGEIALAMKAELESSLGLTFGVGLAPNKTLAKVASKHRKPGGFTEIDEANIVQFVSELPIGKIWGIGTSSVVRLLNLGIRTAADLASKDMKWMEDNHIPKPWRQIGAELRGGFARELNVDSEQVGSIMKTRTFIPPRKERSVVLSHLAKNIEAACIKARRHKVKAREISFYLKAQTFTYRSFECVLPHPTALPTDILGIVTRYFDKVYVPDTLYRATGITLRALVPEILAHPDLFGEHVRGAKGEAVFQAVDSLNHHYGSGTVFLASSLLSQKHGQGGPEKKTLDIPILGVIR